MRSVCFLSAHLPSSTALQAGQRLAYDNLTQIADRYVVSLICYANRQEREHVDPTLHDLCRDVTILPATPVTRMAGVIRNPRLPIFVAFRASGDIARWIERKRRHGTRVAYWMEYSQMAQYVPAIRREGERWIVVCHDVLSQFFQRRYTQRIRLDRWVLKWEDRRLRRWERQVFRRADHVVVFSNKDRLLLNASEISNVCVVHPRVAGRFRSCERALNGPTVLFWGAMNRPENEDAVLWFTGEVWPMIRQVVPSARLVVVGADPSPKVQRLGAPGTGIDITGFVQEPTSWFRQAWLSVAPIRVGAGVKVKVLESIAAGVPVVATSVGAEGIEASTRDGLLVADDPLTFARHCTVLLSARQRSLSLGAAAKKWFAESYASNQLTAERLQVLIEGEL